MHDQIFPRTHDVRLLLQLVIVINPVFQQHEEASEILTPYATEFRYPRDVMQPTEDELQEAIEKAKALFTAVTSLLSEQIRGYLI